MSIKMGIVGLPNVGKSTLFNALSSAGAEAANFPFCTIDPNVGIVTVPDSRLDVLAEMFGSEAILPTTIEFVDIAGLVKGASQGEGLGNQFLSHIRMVDAIAHVVRCFDDDNVVHVNGQIDPSGDIEIIDTELALRDLDSVEKRIHKTSKQTKTGGKAGEDARSEMAALELVQKCLADGKPARILTNVDDCDEAVLEIVAELQLLTAKPVLFVGNVAEDMAADPMQSPHYVALAAEAKKQGAGVVAVSAAIEAEVSQLDKDEQAEFLESLDLKEPGLNRIVRESYELLGLLTFLTAGPKEARAWTVHKGAKAPQAAGVIHSDFEKKFIRAQVMHFADLKELGSEAAVKSAGKMRAEGKEYIVEDGDVMNFLHGA